MQWTIVVVALAGFAACNKKASSTTPVTKVEIANWPSATREPPSCWIPSHPDPLPRSEPYSDPTYGRAYVPRREYEDAMQNNRELNMEVRGLRECVQKILDRWGEP